MPHVVVVGLLRAIAPGRITLRGNLHIIVPPEVVVPDIPLDSGVAVVLHDQPDGLLIAESITRRNGDWLFA